MPASGLVATILNGCGRFHTMAAFLCFDERLRPSLLKRYTILRQMRGTAQPSNAK